MASSLRQIVFGNPLSNEEYEHQRLTKVKALAVFSSDALSSVAYASEEILLVLSLAGAAALWISLPISLIIAALLVVVAISYFQTIHAYPTGGGSYIVAHENLGVWPGLSAAAALLIDYVLTVAVSITAGIVALTSAFPALIPWRVPLCLLAILFITVANLRGVRESGAIFAIPTYAFVFTILTMIAIGVSRLAFGSLDAGSYPELPPDGKVPEAITLYFVLRAFASGCTALTGIEAISDGVPVFHKPESQNAGRTLIAMAILLTTMFLGITYLAHGLHIAPIEHESVVSQIGRRILGGGTAYYALQGATMLILVLAANTAFSDFPRLCSILARDGYMPRQLSNLGDRLVFSNGIVSLALLAAFLIILFGGDTHRLIPLYAIGVFLSFTLSQAGMVRRIMKLKESRWHLKAFISGLGACTTGVVLLVLIEAKFIHGAWIILVLIPIFVFIFHEIKRHYVDFVTQVVFKPGETAAWNPIKHEIGPKVVVPISGVHRGTLPALEFARSLSTDVTAVMVDLEPKSTERTKESWKSWNIDVPLAIVPSPYRSVNEPLLEYLGEVDQRDPERGLAVVVLPELVPARWWQHFLHNQTAFLLKTMLTYRADHTGHGRVIINVPFYLK